MFLSRFVFFVMMLLNTTVASNRKNVKKTSKTKLIGNRASEGQVPYFVSVKEVYSFGDEDGVRTWKHICTGCIISESKFITAAHCFTTKTADSLRAVAGSHYKFMYHNDDSESTIDSQWRKLAQVTISDYFFFPYHDIAVAFVATEWLFGLNVNSAPMAETEFMYTKPCVTLGFFHLGIQDRPLNESQVLVVSKVNVLKQEDCPAFSKVSNKFVCTRTGDEKYVDYESGSPLVCKKNLSPPNVPHTELLVGIMSVKNNDVTLYTRISYFYDWIESVQNKRPLEIQARRGDTKHTVGSRRSVSSDIHRSDLQSIGLNIIIIAFIYILLN